MNKVDSPKSIWLQVRMTPQDKAKLVKLAKRRKQSMSETIRALVVEAA